VREVPIILVVVQSVADDKHVRNLSADITYGNMGTVRYLRFAEEGAHLDAPRIP
jgi:hypothetical protein